MGAVRSKGSILLARVALGQAEKALKVGVSRVALNRWEMGHSRPADAHQATILELWGIPVAAWTLLPSDPDPPGMPPIGPRDLAPLLDDELGASSTSVEGRVAEIERALDRLMADLTVDEDLTKRERGNVLETALRMVGQLAKMKGTYELGARLFKLPVYQRLEDTILEVLKPWPEAMRALADALERLEEEQGR